jgi:hypothetical protein
MPLKGKLVPYCRAASADLDRSLQIGTDIVEAEYDLGLCTHTALSTDKCMAIPDGECYSRQHDLSGFEYVSCLLAQNDWRFKNHVSGIDVCKAARSNRTFDISLGLPAETSGLTAARL